MISEGFSFSLTITWMHWYIVGKTYSCFFCCSSGSVNMWSWRGINALVVSCFIAVSTQNGASWRG